MREVGEQEAICPGPLKIGEQLGHWFHVLHDSSCYSRKKWCQVGSLWVADQVQRLWGPPVLGACLNSTPLMNGEKIQERM